MLARLMYIWREPATGVQWVHTLKRLQVPARGGRKLFYFTSPFLTNMAPLSLVVVEQFIPIITYISVRQAGEKQGV
jgi:hypothetical protein